MKKLDKKGFTLAELLIVVAIIAVLVAISVPVFTAQLEKSRESTDAANLRAAYAAVLAAGMEGAADASNGVTMAGDVGARTFTATVKAVQTQAEWQNPNLEKVGNYELGTGTDKLAAVLKGSTWTVEYSEATSAITIAAT